MKALLPLIKIDSMSSIEIAELSSKLHKNVLTDCRKLKVDYEKLYINQPAEITALIKSSTYIDKNNEKQPLFLLSKQATLDLISGYSLPLRHKINKRWQYLEEQLDVVKFRDGDKDHQKKAMAALQYYLPDNVKNEKIPYIKANTVVNKAISNLFGLPKMIKKDDMSTDMQKVRETALDDYLKLFEVLEDNSQVAELLYGKYQPKRLEESQ